MINCTWGSSGVVRWTPVWQFCVRLNGRAGSPKSAPAKCTKLKQQVYKPTAHVISKKIMIFLRMFQKTYVIILNNVRTKTNIAS